MPARIKIMSWNLRCYGTRNKTADELRLIANTILESQADIICIQELMIGHGVGNNIGDPISVISLNRFTAIWQELRQLDQMTDWRFAVTGRNKGIGVGQADAYGFLWKFQPGSSNFTHLDSIIQISLAPVVPPYNVNPCILRFQPHNQDNFDGRRPGMLSLQLCYKDDHNHIQEIVLNLISFHAKLFTNYNYRPTGVPAAGRAIQRLCQLNEIGGGNWHGVPVPMPNQDVIVLGDFNFDVRNPNNIDQNPYGVFPYQMRIGNDQKTTYTNNFMTARYGNHDDRYVSIYDNIFDNPNSPNLNFQNSNVIDFINNMAPIFGLDGFGWGWAWLFYYGVQVGHYDLRGISDHMPVVAEYSIGVDHHMDIE